MVVTGTPGTGKTKFSIRLAKEIGARYVSVNRLAKQMKSYTAVDRRRNSKIVAIGKLRSHVRTINIPNERMLILDSHILGIAPRSMTKKVFVLRCHPKVLQKRLRRRGWKWQKIQENVLAEILDSCLIEAIEEYGPRKVKQLITSTSDLAEPIKRAKQILSGKLVRKVNVNWLTRLHNDPKLQGYLKG